MEDQEYNNVYAIPANFTDSGKLFGGMIEPRNAIEALLLVLAIGYPELMLISMPTMVRIVVMVVTLIPLGVIAVMGVDGDSLFRYLGHIFRHLLHRRTLHCRRVGYRYGPKAPVKHKGKTRK